MGDLPKMGPPLPLPLLGEPVLWPGSKRFLCSCAVAAGEANTVLQKMETVDATARSFILTESELLLRTMMEGKEHTFCLGTSAPLYLYSQLSDARYLITIFWDRHGKNDAMS